MVVEIRNMEEPGVRMGFVWLSAFPRVDTFLDFMGNKMVTKAIGLPHLTLCDDYITALNSGVREHEERTPIIFVSILTNSDE